MVLVDTSVMVAFLRGVEERQVQALEDIIKRGIPFGINHYIYQEIIQGAKSKSEFNLLIKYLETQRFYDLRNGRKSFEAAAKLYFNCRRKGVTVRSTIDLLIAQTAIENELFLLHHDKEFSNIAKVEKDLKEYSIE